MQIIAKLMRLYLYMSEKNCTFALAKVSNNEKLEIIRIDSYGYYWCVMHRESE